MNKTNTLKAFLSLELISTKLRLALLMFIISFLPISTASAIPGSHETIQSPVYATWNSFLDQTNVLVLTNKGTDPMLVFLSLYDRLGARLHYISVDVPAKSERDVIVNDLLGFSEDNYGIIRIDFDRPGAFEGHSVNYREGAGGDYEFAVTRPLLNPVHASSLAFFNNIQPSQNVDEAHNDVITYVQISNLEDYAESYTLERYDQTGTLLSTTSDIAIAAQGRQDVPVISEAGQVGLLLVRPSNFNSVYLAQVVSYGSNKPAGVAPTAFNFAFSEEFQDVLENFEAVKYLNVSRGAGAQNWLALSSLFGKAVNLRVIDNHGNQVLDTELSPGLRGQLHVDLNQVLDEGESGVAILTPASDDTVIANLRAYYSDSAGRITTASLQEFVAASDFSFTTPIESSLYGTYNTFLGNLNWLRLFNLSPFPASIKVELFDQLGRSLGDRDVNIPAGQGRDVELGSMLFLSLSTNNYGLVKVTPTFFAVGSVGGKEVSTRGSFGSSSLVSQLLRLKRSSSDLSVVDLANPSQLGLITSRLCRACG